MECANITFPASNTCHLFFFLSCVSFFPVSRQFHCLFLHLISLSLLLVLFFFKKIPSPLSQPIQQGSDFNDKEFSVGTVQYHPSNMFHLQLGIEEDTFSKYSVDQPVPQQMLRSRPPIDFSSHLHPPSLTSGSMVYSSLGSIVAPKVVPITCSSRFSPEDLSSLTIPELCQNAHYCKLHNSHNYTSWVLAKYLRKDLQVGEHCAPCGANGSCVADVYQGMLLVHYEVYSLNHIS